jgi:hypothetical protein
MSEPWFYDTETCGLHGPIVLIQHAVGDGEIEMHSPWTEPAHTTIELIEEMMFHDGGIIGFNLAFDHFHLCQMYTTLLLLPDQRVCPEDIIEEYAMLEEKARFGPCLKPQKALDLMLHARKGPYQSTMERKDIRIKRVPSSIANELARELSKRIPLPDVYFARRKDKTVRWQVADIKNEADEVIPDFKDVVLRFSPSSALKALCVDAGISKDERLLFADISLPSKAMPKELGYAPFATAPLYEERKIIPVGPGDWKGKWPDVIHMHISHWTYNSMAREYAYDDVIDTRNLYNFFDKPELGDDDSELACAVAAVRWRGFRIDAERIKTLRDKAVKEEVKLLQKFNYQAAANCLVYLKQVMDDTEKLALIKDGTQTTAAAVLESIAQWKNSEVCEHCLGEGCHECDDGFVKTNELHPAAKRAQEILNARHAKKKLKTMTNYSLLIDSMLLSMLLVPLVLVCQVLTVLMLRESKELKKCVPRFLWLTLVINWLVVILVVLKCVYATLSMPTLT